MVRRNDIAVARGKAVERSQRGRKTYLAQVGAEIVRKPGQAFQIALFHRDARNTSAGPERSFRAAICSARARPMPPTRAF